MAEEMKQKGLSKLAPKAPSVKKPAEPEPKGEPEAKEMGGEHTTTITHHADGTHSMQHSGGGASDHPDHLHLMAHLGHHLTGGDAHHVMHHDGMEEHHHSIEESGEHHDGPLQGMNDGQQPEEEHQEMEPTYGGM